MMFNFFKKQKPEITFWSEIEGLEQVCPPVPMREYIPKWFKNMPNSIDSNQPLHPGTAKRCPAFMDFWENGWVIPLWCDLEVITDKDNNFSVRTPEDNFRFDTHLDNQFIDHIPKNSNYEMILKAVSPWRIMTPKGYSVLQLPMFYDFNKDFTVLPGTIWTDVHYEVNQQIAIHNTGRTFIPRGTPLAVYIPIKREKWKFTISELTEQLRYKTNIAYYHWASKFKDGYREHIQKIKKDQ